VAELADLGLEDADLDGDELVVGAQLEVLAVDVAAEGLDARLGEVELGLADVGMQVLDEGMLLGIAALGGEELAVERLEPVADLLHDRAFGDAAFAGGGGEAEHALALEVLGDGAVGADALEAELVRRGLALQVAAAAVVGVDL